MMIKMCRKYNLAVFPLSLSLCSALHEIDFVTYIWKPDLETTLTRPYHRRHNEWIDVDKFATKFHWNNFSGFAYYMQYFFRIIIGIKINLRMEMVNVSKRQQQDQKSRTQLKATNGSSTQRKKTLLPEACFNCP